MQRQFGLKKIHNPICKFTPAEVIVDGDGDIEIIEKKKPEGRKYLAGERLLIKLSKNNKKKHEKKNNLDLTKIEVALGNLLRDFS